MRYVGLTHSQGSSYSDAQLRGSHFFQSRVKTGAKTCTVFTCVALKLMRLLWETKVINLDQLKAPLHFQNKNSNQ